MLTTFDTTLPSQLEDDGAIEAASLEVLCTSLIIQIGIAALSVNDVNFFEGLAIQIEIKRLNVFLKLLHCRRANDGAGHVRAALDPRQRELGGRQTPSLCHVSVSLCGFQRWVAIVAGLEAFKAVIHTKIRVNTSSQQSDGLPLIQKEHPCVLHNS